MLREWIRKTIELPAGGRRGRKLLLALAAAAGVLAMVWPAGNTPPAADPTEAISRKISDRRQALADDLAAVLSQVEGAGQVEVRVTLASDGFKTYAVNRQEETRRTEETDASGGSRISSEDHVTLDVAASGGQALLIEERYPEVVGVLVVAEGGGDPTVRAALHDAVVTLLNIAPHHVEVLPRKEEK
jgi:stage III sporulation protein AG